MVYVCDKKNLKNRVKRSQGYLGGVGSSSATVFDAITFKQIYEPFSSWNNQINRVNKLAQSDLNFIEEFTLNYNIYSFTFVYTILNGVIINYY